MPELPEVEAARRALAEHCVGRKIVKCVAADDEKVIDGVSPRRLEAALLGRTIVDARRKGKNLWLALDAPPSPSFQFGMTGAIYIKGVELTKYKRSAVSPSEEWPLKYSKLFVELDDGLEFSFTDKRRFAKIRLLDNPEGVSPISELGPDALFEPMQLDDFVQSLSRKNVPIKALLLDQSFISGIGNWVGDEVLYQARIHPMLSASKIPKEKCETLHQCIKEVIEKALEAGADSSQFPKGWIFHSREKKPNNAFVDGKKIDFITVGGRTSAFVPELQKLDGIDASASRSRRGKDRGMDDDSKSKTGRNARKEGKKEAKKGTVDDVEEEEREKKPAKKTKTRVSKSLSNIAVKTHGNDHKGDNEVEEAIPVERGRNQPAKVAKRKAFNTNDDNNKQEDTKPVKRGRKQPGKAPRGSSKTAVYTNDDGIEDEEEVPPAKRGRKQSVKVAKSSSKKADDIIADDDEVAEDETEAKPVKRGKGQSAKVAKSSSKKE